MAEASIWKGTSSHWKNIKYYLLFIAALIFAAYGHVQHAWTWAWIVPAVAGLWAFWKLLVLKSISYELTDERLITTRGILTKVTDTLELYRVRDMQVVQPLLLRLLGLKNIHLFASDATSEQMILDYLPNASDLGEQLRKAVENCRERKRVRAFDVVSETPGDQASDATL